MNLIGWDTEGNFCKDLWHRLSPKGKHLNYIDYFSLAAAAHNKTILMKNKIHIFLFRRAIFRKKILEELFYFERETGKDLPSFKKN